jgi:hypothetical protein
VETADSAAAAWCRETMRERSADFDTTVRRDGSDLLVDLD